MVVGIILLLFGIFLIFMAWIGVNNFDENGNNSTSAAELIIVFFVIGAFLMIGGGYRMDDYIWPPENKTESILER